MISTIYSINTPPSLVSLLLPIHNLNGILGQRSLLRRLLLRIGYSPPPHIQDSPRIASKHKAAYTDTHHIHREDDYEEDEV